MSALTVSILNRIAALDKCLIHCYSLLCPLWISSSDTLMQRLLLSYAVICVCECVCKLGVNVLLLLWVVWAVMREAVMWAHMR